MPTLMIFQVALRMKCFTAAVYRANEGWQCLMSTHMDAQVSALAECFSATRKFASERLGALVQMNMSSETALPFESPTTTLNWTSMLCSRPFEFCLGFLKSPPSWRVCLLCFELDCQVFHVFSSLFFLKPLTKLSKLVGVFLGWMV